MTPTADTSRRRFRMPLTRRGIVAVGFLVFAVVLPVMWSTPPVVVQVAPHRPLDGAASPREQPTAVTLNAGAAVALVPAAYTTPTSGYCINASATQTVWKVREGATSTAGGDGPYCADAALCPAGPTLPIAGRAWGILGAGLPLVVRCSFVDDGNGFSSTPRAAGGAPGAPDDATYLLQAADGDLPNARTLAAGAGISLVDTGPGGTMTVVNAGQVTAACALTGGAGCIMTGAIRADDALTNCTTASVAFDGDPNTGLVRVAADTLALCSGGTETLRAAGSTLTLPANVSAAGAGTLLGFSSGLSAIQFQGGQALGTPALRSILDTTTGWSPRMTITGAASGTAQTFSANSLGVLQLGGGSSATAQRVIAANDTTGSGGTTTTLFLPPRSIGTSPMAAPVCAAGILGAELTLDDTDDSKPGIECKCTLNSDNTTHEWLFRRLLANIPEGWEGTGCVIP